MKRQTKELTVLGKRNAYNLFFKYHRLLLLQSLTNFEEDGNIINGEATRNHNNNCNGVSHTHWSHHNDLVKNWNSQTVRPCDFPTFESFMMHVLEINLEEQRTTYLKREERKHTKTHGLMNLHNMATKVSEIWKSKKKEMMEIFKYYAELDEIRYEQDLAVYNRLNSRSNKNKKDRSSDDLPDDQSELQVTQPVQKKRRYECKPEETYSANDYVKCEILTITAVPVFTADEGQFLARLLF